MYDRLLIVLSRDGTQMTFRVIRTATANDGDPDGLLLCRPAFRNSMPIQWQDRKKKSIVQAAVRNALHDCGYRARTDPYAIQRKDKDGNIVNARVEVILADDDHPPMQITLSA